MLKDPASISVYETTCSTRWPRGVRASNSQMAPHELLRAYERSRYNHNLKKSTATRSLSQAVRATLTGTIRFFQQKVFDLNTKLDDLEV